jgi:hypothetical protein
MKQKNLSGAVALIAITVSTWGCVGPFSEHFESHYANVAAARHDGAFVRGWLPEIVPDEAIDIWEMHNVDSNRTWACFGIPKGPATVRALLEKAGAHRIAGPPGTRPPGILGPPTWWLASMAQPRIEAYELKENRGSVLHIRIDAAAERVCFERTAS